MASVPAPLSGTKTHPLTDTAIRTLRDLLRNTVPCQEINPGLSNRLLREALVDEVILPSPYATHKGRGIPHYQISDAGRERLASIDQSKGKRS